MTSTRTCTWNRLSQKFTCFWTFPFRERDLCGRW